MQNSDTILSVQDLKTYFHLSSGVARAVDGVSFSLRRGETLGIVGESGSGKSVTASSIIRLLAKVGRIESGEISFEGRDVLSFDEKELLAFRGRDVSMIFQDPMTSLDPVFKVGTQMVEALREHHPEIGKEKARRICIESLDAVGIPRPEVRIDAYPYELSGGMCQRVFIAMALCCKPKLIIADEPTTALDVTVQAQVLELLRELQQQSQMAMLLITHNLGVVWSMCHNVMVMYAGKTVEYAPVGELYSAALHPYTWGLLDSMPSFHNKHKAELKTISGAPPDLRLTGTCCNFYNRCPYALPLCAEEVPELVEVKENHFVACHRQTRDSVLERGKEDSHD